MSIRERTTALYHRARGSGLSWKRLAVLVITAVAIYGIYSAYEQSMQNGRRLDSALDALHHANSTTDSLKVLLIESNRKSAAFRKALKAAGVPAAQIRQIERQAAAQTTPGPSPEPGHSPQPQPQPQPQPRPSPRPQPPPRPSHSPSPRPHPSQSPCAAYNPLTGKCAVRLPPFLPHADVVAPGVFFVRFF